MDTVITDASGLTEEEAAMLEEALVQAHEDTNSNLPLNSKSLLIDDSSSRFSSAIWFEEIKKQIVLLAGLGGIGSYVAFLLGRLKVGRIVAYDNDTVDGTNLSGQLFSTTNVGQLKVSAVAEILRNFANYYSILGRNTLYYPYSEVANIMICGFDNMASRKTFYNCWKTYVMNRVSNHKEDCLFIDGRLAAEEFQVFCIRGTDDYLMKKYEENWLFDDKEAEETICSYKQTSFCANMIASVIVNLFTNFIANKCNPLIERELPFYTRYDAERMYLRTETV